MLFDNKNIVGIVLMDISKAFDCIPYVLPVAILHAYGLSKNPTTFIYSHLKPKKKRDFKIYLVRLLLSDVPQGSILSPMLFNILINDFCL